MRGLDFIDDMGVVGGRIAEFEKRHGGEANSIYHNGWIRYADGAVRESNPVGLLMEPPANPFDLAKHQLIYYRIIFERALQKFRGAKQQIAALAHANLNSPLCGAAPAIDDATRELKALQSLALEAKENMDKAAAAVENAKPWHLKANQQRNADNRNRNEELLAAVAKIEL